MIAFDLTDDQISVLSQIVVGIWTVYITAVTVRYFWLTRRQPVRDDAPTDGPWVKPSRFHR